MLNGVPAKGNSGIFMGPLYYYLIAPVYLLTNLDPIASPIFAGITSIFGFFVVYYVTKKLFGTNVALVALFINTFSISVITGDRIQNAIGLIVPISYLIFYFLYKAVTENAKNLIYLAAVTGFAFHVDFTSVMYPLILALALPFLPRNKKTLQHLLISLLIFLIFISPIIFNFATKDSSGNAFGYFNTFYHGIHFQRIIQLFHDAFLSFQGIMYFAIFRPFVVLIVPIFFYIYYKINPKRQRQSLLLFYLIILWILIPWIILSTYSGELTDSYFYFPKDIAIAMIAFLTVFQYQQRNILIKLIPIIFWGFYAYYSLQYFFKPQSGNLLGKEQYIKSVIKAGKVIGFKDHQAEPYLYYIYMRQLKKEVY